MITAEEFFRNKIKEETHLKENITLANVILNAEQTMRWAHEYSILKAKFHVEEALKSASKNHNSTLYIKGTYKGAKWIGLKEGMEYNPMEKSIMTKTDKKSILKAYPLTNIK